LSGKRRTASKEEAAKTEKKERLWARSQRHTLSERAPRDALPVQ
jgi:hypothetical protein